MSQEYKKQARGDDSAYQRYLAGMDSSMRQKVATTAAHLLGEGTVADMGMGSGAGSAALANLYPHLRVVGVDVSEEMVRRARERYAIDNLSFVVGDVASQLFDDASLTGIFNSSVLHHVTSFNGYRYSMAEEALRNQVTQLAFGGTLIVRDFLAPREGSILFDVPSDDGDESSNPKTMSSARLLERFSREFRPLSDSPGFVLEPVTGAVDVPPGRCRYRLEHRMAVEFALRKDYRDDYESELLEEYTYFTQIEFERVFARLGLRLLASVPIQNPWIVKRRFEGKLAFFSPEGTRLDYPPTNYLVVGERVTPDQGVRFEQREARSPSGFLELLTFVNKTDGTCRELVRRPGTTLDIVPWFRERDALYVLVRRSHPRPVLQALTQAALDGSTSVGYVTEPILALLSDAPLGLTVERTLEKAAQIDPSTIRSMREAGNYYPSPGGIIEEVRAVHVEVTPQFLVRPLTNTTGFSTTGVLRAVDARQLLRAAQVGALPDARLELNVYELLLTLEEPIGPWIGAEVLLADSPDGCRKSLVDAIPAPRRSFKPSATPVAADFLELRCHDFVELDSNDAVLNCAPREYVVPRQLSTNTIVCALLRRCGGEVRLGVDEDDLAAAQALTGNSSLLVAPAWRLPKTETTLRQAIAWTSARLEESYGLSVAATVELGGRYLPSSGLTPEVVFPIAVSVRDEGDASSRLRWIPLLEVIWAIDQIRDGHLRIVALRAAHALGLLR